MLNKMASAILLVSAFQTERDGNQNQEPHLFKSTKWRRQNDHPSVESQTLQPQASQPPTDLLHGFYVLVFMFFMTTFAR